MDKIKDAKKKDLNSVIIFFYNSINEHVNNIYYTSF